MRMNDVLKHSRDHADWQYVSYVRVDHKGNKHTNTQLYILVHILTGASDIQEKE